MAPNDLTYGKKPLVLIDLLGFTKYTLGARSINDIISTYKKFVYDAKSGRSPSINKMLEKAHRPQFLVFSDSIIMYMDDRIIKKIKKDMLGYTNLKSHIHYMIYYLSDVVHNSILSLARQSNRSPVPIRAAFVFDEYFGTERLKVGSYTDDDGRERPYTARAVLGKGAIRAYQWEEKQKWIGASFKPKTSCCMETDNKDTLDELLKKKLIMQHSVPTDIGLIDTYAINFVTESSHTKLLKALECAESDAKSPAIKCKYNATKKFLEECCRKKYFRPELTYP